MPRVMQSEQAKFKYEEYFRREKGEWIKKSRLVQIYSDNELDVLTTEIISEISKIEEMKEDEINFEYEEARYAYTQLEKRRKLFDQMYKQIEKKKKMQKIELEKELKLISDKRWKLVTRMGSLEEYLEEKKWKKFESENQIDIVQNDFEKMCM